MFSTRDPVGDLGGRHLGRRQAQEEQLDPVAHRLPARDSSCMAATAQRGLEGEAVSSAHVFPDLLQHQPAGPDRGQVRAKGAEPRRDEIGIDEDRALRLVRQEFGGESGLSGSVRPGDDENPPGGVTACRDAAAASPPCPRCTACRAARPAPTTARSESRIPITIVPLLVLAMRTKTSASFGAIRPSSTANEPRSSLGHDFPGRDPGVLAGPDGGHGRGVLADPAVTAEDPPSSGRASSHLQSIALPARRLCSRSAHGQSGVECRRCCSHFP